MQLDLFTAATTARPTQRSACRVIAHVARRLGYDFVGMCEHCGQGVTLAGAWGPLGWLHRNGSPDCNPRTVAQREQFSAFLVRNGDPAAATYETPRQRVAPQVTTCTS